MSDHFYLLLGQVGSIEDEALQVSWCREHAGEVAPVNQGTLTEAAEACHDAHITVIVPGQYCTAVKAHLPNISRGRLAQALPYALEEQLIDDVEKLHFAMGEFKGEDVSVLTMRAEQLTQWMTLLESYGIIPQRVIADYLSISWPRDGWHLWLDDGAIILRSGPYSGLRIIMSDPLQLLHYLYNSCDQLPEQLMVSGMGDELREPLSKWGEEHEIVLVEGESEPQLLTQAVTVFHQERGINLLQGRFSHQEQLSRQWRPWIPAAAVLAVMALLQLIMMGMDYSRLSDRYMALDTQIEQLYRDTFPDANNVVDARYQMEKKLSQLGQSGGSDTFYALLGGVTSMAEEQVSFDLQRLRYQGGELSVDLQLEDLQVLDRIKQLLGQKSGIQAEVVSASARGSKVEARLLIKEGGA